jgi:hypothetical protein
VTLGFFAMSTVISTAALQSRAPSDDHERLESQKKPVAHQVTFERRLGETEASYFLPSRENGVNDMWGVLCFSCFSVFSNLHFRYLHLGFNAPQYLLKRDRVRAVWAILRLRHPLLSSKAEMHDYEDIRFVCVAIWCFPD